MFEGFEALEVPPPLDDCLTGGENADEPERIHLGEQ